MIIVEILGVYKGRQAKIILSLPHEPRTTENIKKEVDEIFPVGGDLVRQDVRVMVFGPEGKLWALS